MEEPVCARCKVTSSLMWEKNKEGEVLCLECHSSSRQEPAPGVGGRDRPAPSPSSLSNSREPAATTSSTSACEQAQSSATGHIGRRTRLRNAKGRYGKATSSSSSATDKTTRNSATPSSSASPAPQSSAVGGGNRSPAPPPSQPAAQPTSSSVENGASQCKKASANAGRRSLIKITKPTKAPAFEATIITSDTVLYKGTRYEVGDIVSILDESGKVYYALLRGFLEDQYAEKYAALTWLIPTTPNPKDFNPSLFVLGPEEDSPKDMECLDFVTHSPQSASFLPSLSRDSDLALLWTGQKRRRVMFTS